MHRHGPLSIRTAVFLGASACLWLVPAGASAQSSETAWDNQYASMLKRLDDADAALAEVDGRKKAVLAQRQKPKPELLEEEKTAVRNRAQALRNVENMLRRSAMRKRPMLAGLYLDRARAVRNDLERVAMQDQAELVLRESANFFFNQQKSLSNDNPQQAQAKFEFRMLSVRTRRALADHVLEVVVYPALDEYEVYNNLNEVVQRSAASVTEAINAYNQALTELDDLVGEARDQQQRLIIGATLEGYTPQIKNSTAWARYYRAWLTPSEVKGDAAKLRREDLNNAFDTFQDMANNKSLPENLRQLSELGMALVTREQGKAREAADLLRKIADFPQMNSNKVQAMWELARTYGTYKNYVSALAMADELQKLKPEADKRFREIEAAKAKGDDPPADFPGIFYINWAPSMKLNLLFEWKNSDHPDRSKAELDFDKLSDTLTKAGDPWPMLIEAFLKRRIFRILKDPKAPAPDEMQQLRPSERLTMARRFLGAEPKIALTYFQSILNEKGVFTDEAMRAQQSQILMDVAQIYYQIYSGEKEKLAGKEEKPDASNLVEFMTILLRLTKEVPDSPQGKNATAMMPWCIREIETVFPDRAQDLLKGNKVAALEDFIAKNPNDKGNDRQRIVLCKEYMALADGAKPADREKMIAKGVEHLMAIRNNKPEYIYGQVHAAEIHFKELYRIETSGGKVKPNVQRYKNVAEMLLKAADLALEPPNVEPPLTPDQRNAYKSIAAAYILTASELYTRPTVSEPGQAIAIIDRYDIKFVSPIREQVWERDDILASQYALRVQFLQDTNKATEAQAWVEKLLGLKEGARYVGRLFNQTRRLIEQKPDKAADYSKQGIKLAETLLQLPKAKSDPEYAAAIRTLIVEMQILSNDETQIAAALAKAEEELKKDPKNGPYQIFKAECFTKMALKSGDDDKAWTKAGTEWKKLTEDHDMRTKPEYRDFYWQAWWNRLAVRCEMSLKDWRIVEELKNALKNLKGIYGTPTEKWEGRFDELNAAVSEGGSAYRR